MSMEKEARELCAVLLKYYCPDDVERANAYLTKLVAEAKAEAYEDAAKALSEPDCYCAHHDAYPEGPCYIEAKASALRRESK